MNRRILLTNRLSTQKLANGITKRRTLRLLPSQRSSRLLRGRRSGQARNTGRNTNRKLVGKIRAGIKRLREEMAEISEEQKCIREGQRQVREKFEKIEAERVQLWKETEIISKQNAGIQLRLGLMSGIVKARAQNDYDLAARLTQSLRLFLLTRVDCRLNLHLLCRLVVSKNPEVSMSRTSAITFAVYPRCVPTSKGGRRDINGVQKVMNRILKVMNRLTSQTPIS